MLELCTYVIDPDRPKKFFFLLGPGYSDDAAHGFSVLDRENPYRGTPAIDEKVLTWLETKDGD